jgi:diguanylate cyclase (GGDEF)-like protein
MRDNVTIAIVAPIQPEDFFDLLWQGVWEATFDLSSFGVEVQNLTTQSDDFREQRKILELLLDTRPDAIGLMPVHATALDDLIGRHALQGTPVVTFHGDAPASGRVAFVKPDLHQSGVLAGEVLIKLIHGQGRILSFLSSLSEYQVACRYQGFRQALAPYAGRIEETQCCLNSDASSVITPELMQAFGPMAGYYIGSHELVRIATILEGLGAQCPCLGFSNTQQVGPLLERGAVSAVVDENRYQVGYFAVQKAYEAVLKCHTGAPLASVQIPSSVVFAANASGAGDSLGSAFELLVRQRTEILVSYKDRLEEANGKLRDLAVTDPLTGLYNRRRFEEVLGHEVDRALRYGPVSLLLIDLDYFKSVNDRYGHQTGDDALKVVAQVLQSCCRATDTCARLGGDEFAIILPHSGPSAAAVVRTRIQQQIAFRVVPAAQDKLTVSLSIGIATAPGDADNTAKLIAAADAAMYQVKQASHLEERPVA